MAIVLEEAEGGSEVPRRAGDKLPAMHRKRLCIVMVCEDVAEATQVGQLVSQVNNGSLVTYRKAEDVLLNYPAGRVVLIILAASQDPTMTGRTLAWMRHRWPHSPITVIGDTGGGELEIVARSGGANFITRPVRPEEWAAMVNHVLAKKRTVTKEVELG